MPRGFLPDAVEKATEYKRICKGETAQSYFNFVRNADVDAVVMSVRVASGPPARARRFRPRGALPLTRRGSSPFAVAHEGGESAGPGLVRFAGPATDDGSSKVPLSPPAASRARLPGRGGLHGRCRCRGLARTPSTEGLS